MLNTSCVDAATVFTSLRSARARRSIFSPSSDASPRVSSAKSASCRNGRVCASPSPASNERIDAAKALNSTAMSLAPSLLAALNASGSSTCAGATAANRSPPLCAGPDILMLPFSGDRSEPSSKCSGLTVTGSTISSACVSKRNASVASGNSFSASLLPRLAPMTIFSSVPSVPSVIGKTPARNVEPAMGVSRASSDALVSIRVKSPVASHCRAKTKRPVISTVVPASNFKPRSSSSGALERSMAPTFVAATSKRIADLLATELGSTVISVTARAVTVSLYPLPLATTAPPTGPVSANWALAPLA